MNKPQKNVPFAQPDGMMTIETYVLLASMQKLIQEQAALIAALDARVTALEP